MVRSSIKQRLGIGILGGLPPAGHLLREEPPLSAVSTQFSRVQAPRFQESCHPSDQYTRGLEAMTNASDMTPFAGPVLLRAGG